LGVKVFAIMGSPLPGWGLSPWPTVLPR
jgi:hypothetical protein